MNQTESTPEAAEFAFIDCAGIHVAHHETLDGGGPRTWPGYVEQVRARIGPVEHAFEWCAGPGYIGFALIAIGGMRGQPAGYTSSAPPPEDAGP